MNYEFTSRHLTLDNLERSNEDHWVFIVLCILDNVLLDNGAVRPRGLLFFSPLLTTSFDNGIVS